MTLTECFKRYLCCTCVVRRRTIASRLCPAVIQLMIIAVVWYIFQARANLQSGLVSVLAQDAEGRTLCSPGDYSKGRVLSLSDIMSTNANVVSSSRSEQPQYLNVEVIVRDLQGGTLVSYEVGTPVITSGGVIERVKADEDYPGHDDASKDIAAAVEGGENAALIKLTDNTTESGGVKPLDIKTAVDPDFGMHSGLAHRAIIQHAIDHGGDMQAVLNSMNSKNLNPNGLNQPSAPGGGDQIVQNVDTSSGGNGAGSSDGVGSVHVADSGTMPNGQSVIGQSVIGQSNMDIGDAASLGQAGVPAGAFGTQKGAGVNPMPVLQLGNQVNGQLNQQNGQLNQQNGQLNQQNGDLHQTNGQLDQPVGQFNQPPGVAPGSAVDLRPATANQPGNAAGLVNQIQNVPQDVPQEQAIQVAPSVVDGNAGADEHGPLFAEGLNDRMMQFKMELYGKASDTIEVDRTSNFLMNNENRCDGEPEVDILFLIHAQPQSDDRRTAIRMTFVKSDLFKDARMAHVFLLGKTNSPNFQKHLDTEHAQFGDIIQGDFLDKPENATMKAIMGFKWTQAYCKGARYVMKIDEDVFVDSDKLLHGLIPAAKELSGPRTIMCYLTSDAPVPRSGPKAFSKELFPHSPKLRPHCKAFAVLMTGGVVSSLLATARHAPYVASEDLYIFGVLPYLAGHIDVFDVGNKRAFHDFGQETVNCYKEMLDNCPLVASKAFSSRFTDLWRFVTERMTSPHVWASKESLWDVNNFRMRF